MILRLRRRRSHGGARPLRTTLGYLRTGAWLQVKLALLLVPSVGTAQDVATLEFRTNGETLVFGSEDITDARPDIGPNGASVLLRLAETAELAFSELTARSIGSEVTVLVCGRVIARVVIQEQLGGAGILPANGIEDADLLAERLRGDTDCLD